MTWLSRILPQSPSLRFADHNHHRRTRQGQRRRRMSTVEALEGRTLLSNITVAQDASDVVTITGDTHNDQFSVVNNANNTITVVGTGTPVKTQVNNHAVGVSWTSPFPALGLVINLPGTGNNLDSLAISGQGQKVKTELKSIAVNVTGTPAVVLTATGLQTASGPGSFTLKDGTATVAGGQLSATLTNDQFSALTIFQTGCCSADVDLENDNVTGAVAVTEGVANGNGIVVDGKPTSFSTFGSTVLTQFAGPTMAGCNGDGDYIKVDDANVKDLTMTQGGNGKGQCIAVGLHSEVEVSDASFGIVASQGNGNGDVIEIVSITTSGKPLNAPHSGPDSIVTSQGNGNGDFVIVDTAQVWGNISEFQGNGNGDCAAITGDTAGWTVSAGPTITDFFGTETIIQGNGYADTATLDCGQIEDDLINYANNVFVSQGTSLAFVGCTPGLGDTINVNCTQVVSSMTLEQGEGDTTSGLGLGNNVVNVATDSCVTVGDSTVINEIGPNNGNNTILLGGASGEPDSGYTDFETGYLDIYSGAAGGAYVQVYNTLVDYGVNGFFGPFNINGDGDGNTAILDDYSSLSVTSAF